MELHAWLEGLVAFHPDGRVARFGSIRDLCKGEGWELQDGRFGVEAGDAELFGVLDDERVLQQVFPGGDDHFGAFFGLHGLIDEALQFIRGEAQGGGGEANCGKK